MGRRCVLRGCSHASRGVGIHRVMKISTTTLQSSTGGLVKKLARQLDKRVGPDEPVGGIQERDFQARLNPAIR